MATGYPANVLINHFFPLQKHNAHPQSLVPAGTKWSLTDSVPKPHKLATKGDQFGFQASAPAIKTNVQASTDKSGNHYHPVIYLTLVSPIHSSRNKNVKVQPKVSCPISPDLSHDDHTDMNRSQHGYNGSAIDNMSA